MLEIELPAAGRIPREYADERRPNQVGPAFQNGDRGVSVFDADLDVAGFEQRLTRLHPVLDITE